MCLSTVDKVPRKATKGFVVRELLSTGRLRSIFYPQQNDFIFDETCEDKVVGKGGFKIKAKVGVTYPPGFHVFLNASDAKKAAELWVSRSSGVFVICAVECEAIVASGTQAIIPHCHAPVIVCRKIKHTKVVCDVLS